MFSAVWISSLRAGSSAAWRRARCVLSAVSQRLASAMLPDLSVARGRQWHDRWPRADRLLSFRASAWMEEEWEVLDQNRRPTPAGTARALSLIKSWENEPNCTLKNQFNQNLQSWWVSVLDPAGCIGSLCWDAAPTLRRFWSITDPINQPHCVDAPSLNNLHILLH